MKLHNRNAVQLYDWQNALQGSVLSETDLLGDRLKPGGVNRQARLGIYANAYTARLREALQCNYPAVYQLLGDDDFDSMARAYLQCYPSGHASIRWFGDHVADFLAANSPYDKLPVLSELARFEWALRHTVDAADADIIEVSTLQTIAPEHWSELCFGVHPSLTILTMAWNVIPIWHALTEDKEPPLPAQEPMHWLVYRQQDLMSVWRSVSDIEITVLRAISAEKTFADICEITAQAVSEEHGAEQHSAAAIVASALRGFVENGFLTLKVQTNKTVNQEVK